MAKKVGRPTKYKEEFCDILLDMMRAGDSIVQFCSKVDISRDTFYRWVRENEQFSDIFMRGKCHCEAYWESQLKMMMFNRDVNAPLVKMYFANRFDWSDKASTDHTSSDGSVKMPDIIRLVGKDD